MMPKAKLLFKFQQVLSFQGWKDHQGRLYLRRRGFWELCIEVAHRYLLPYFLHFILTPFVSFQFKKIKRLFSEIILI